MLVNTSPGRSTEIVGRVVDSLGVISVVEILYSGVRVSCTLPLLPPSPLLLPLSDKNLALPGAQGQD